MDKLIENQIDESQVVGKELEELYGGSGDCNGIYIECICNSKDWADEDDQENVVF